MLAAAAPGEEAAPGLSGSLLVYCAAGIKAAVDPIARQFEQETGVKVMMTFANSGQLIGQMETTHQGDVYIPGDVGFVAKAQARKLTAGTPRTLCYFVPALYVRKGNPKKIMEVRDLVRPGLRVVLADTSAAIGQLQAALFKTNGVDEAALSRNVVATPATVIDVALAVKMGTADVGVVWDAMRGYAPDEGECVAIPADKNVTGVVAATVLKGSKNPSAAQAFVDYLVAEKGRAILRAKGFKVDK
jgi:molybdate transport system substrate-binding protein